MNTNYITIPDLSKEFIVLEDNRKSLERPTFKGIRFKVKKFNYSKVTIKITNTKKELEDLGMLEYDFNRVIRGEKKDINDLKKVCKMWEEPDKFIIDHGNIYKRVDGKTSTYSYQKGKNEFFSKSVYESMLKNQKDELTEWENRIDKHKKTILKWILEPQEVSVDKINKIKFKYYEGEKC